MTTEQTQPKRPRKVHPSEERRRSKEATEVTRRRKPRNLTRKPLDPTPTRDTSTTGTTQCQDSREEQVVHHRRCSTLTTTMTLATQRAVEAATETSVATSPEAPPSSTRDVHHQSTTTEEAHHQCTAEMDLLDHLRGTDQDTHQEAETQEPGLDHHHEEAKWPHGTLTCLTDQATTLGIDLSEWTRSEISLSRTCTAVPPTRLTESELTEPSEAPSAARSETAGTSLKLPTRKNEDPQLHPTPK